MNGTSLILSQGQDILRVGEVYTAVSLGDDIQDPQTGQSLGREQKMIGTILVIRTADKTSIGQLNGTFDASQFLAWHDRTGRPYQ
jgi:hypothetical protein